MTLSRITMLHTYMKKAKLGVGVNWQDFAMIYSTASGSKADVNKGIEQSVQEMVMSAGAEE